MVLKDRHGERGIQIVSEIFEDLNFKCNSKFFLFSNCGTALEEVGSRGGGRKKSTLNLRQTAPT